MAIKKVFSVYDEAAAAFLQPIFFDTTGQAVRAISDSVADPNSSLSRHTSDYSLFLLGEYDDSTGEFKNSKSCLGNCVEFKAKANLTSIEKGN